MDPKIARSARRHRISDERILEAYRHTVVVLVRGDMTMHLGHDAHGVPLEIGVVATPLGPVIVHAMRMRRAWASVYRRFLS
ncbi:MAG: hypothetical protein E6I33_08650 [Chloroflexi bacterium]|nr:MAG: hypothetical protein E6I33_08650 [Chloroflexota bacterium]